MIEEIIAQLIVRIIWTAAEHAQSIWRVIHRWAPAVWRRCYASIASRWVAVWSWPRWRQTLSEASLPVAGTGAIVSTVLYHTMGVVPAWVDGWAIASAVAIAAAGLWIIALLVWRGSRSGAKRARRYLA